MRKSSWAKPVRFEIVDGLRFVSAFWVLLFHLANNHAEAFPLPWQGVDLGFGLQLAISGQMAVIAFFVISGFCIHYPTLMSSQLDAGAFLVRRYVRIGIPLLFVIACGAAFHIETWRLNLWGPSSPLLWTIVCELLFYTAYPLLWPLIRRFGALPVALGSLIPCAFVLAGSRTAHVFQYRGDLLTACVGLPCWLAGTWVAERFARDGQPTGALARWPIPLGRVGIFTVNVLLASHHWVPAPHDLLGIPSLLVLSSPLIALWLLNELRYARLGRWGHLLARMGAAGYSLYLLHPIAQQIWKEQTFGIAFLAPHSWPHLLGSVGFTLGLTWVFYHVLERPSVRLGRWIYRRMQPLAAPPPRPRRSAA